MTDLPFILAAYLVIVGGLAVYTLTLLRRLARARREAPGSPSPEPDEGR
jgi:hypothetical protein